MKLSSVFFYVVFVLFFASNNVAAQDYELVAITSVASGHETNNTLFKANSKTIPSLAYIRAQRIKGPQDGVFVQSKDNIRYISISKKEGMPANLSSIRFSFLQSDKKTLIPPSNFRFVINDIDGPDNEALATKCDASLRFLGTSNPTHLKVLNMSPIIIAAGSTAENDGATSRVMFEFMNVSIIEFDNYANDGYLKDFDMNDDYPILEPVLVKCNTYASGIYTERGTVIADKKEEFKIERGEIMVNTNVIYFDKDKFNIREDAETTLMKVFHILNKYPDLIIEVGSHTDSQSSDEYNLELSNNRAKSSIAWFLNLGIEPSRILGKGYGETQLVNKCSNGVKCTDEEHGLNRRTEFVIVNPEAIN